MRMRVEVGVYFVLLVMTILLSMVGVEGAVKFITCKSFFRKVVGYPPENVEVSGCESTPCHVAKGSYISLTFDFTARSGVSMLRPKVSMQVYGASLPVQSPVSDACKALVEGTCPLNKGDKARFHLDNIYVPDYLPEFNPVIRVAFRDGAGRTHVCAEVPFAVRKKVATTPAVADSKVRGWTVTHLTHAMNLTQP